MLTLFAATVKSAFESPLPLDGESKIPFQITSTVLQLAPLAGVLNVVVPAVATVVAETEEVNCVTAGATSEGGLVVLLIVHPVGSDKTVNPAPLGTTPTIKPFVEVVPAAIIFNATRVVGSAVSATSNVKIHAKITLVFIFSPNFPIVLPLHQQCLDMSHFFVSNGQARVIHNARVVFFPPQYQLAVEVVNSLTKDMLL